MHMHEDHGRGHDHGHAHDHDHNNGCGCGHDHGHDHDAVGSKRALAFMIAGFLVLITAVILQHFTKADDNLVLIAYLIAYLLIGQDVIRGMSRRIAAGRFLDEGFLMIVATVGAFLVGEYAEAVAVMLFYKIGELFEERAVERSRDSIRALTDIRPETVHVKEAHGDHAHWRDTVPEQVRAGQTIRVLPGERVPLDGTIRSGETSLDMKSLTGESVPVCAVTGDQILSGSVNLSSAVEILVEKPYGESTVARILQMVESASERKANAEHFVRRFAQYYTPAVVGCALVLALAGGFIGKDWNTWVFRALTFLVISCPCALVISIPLGFYAGIGRASADGILIKGSNYLEALAQADTIAFDKTGTLTKGEFCVRKVYPGSDFSVSCDLSDARAQEILCLAASLEQDSPHPIAKSIRAAWQGELLPVKDLKEVPGQGVFGFLEGIPVLAGQKSWMDAHGIPVLEQDAFPTVVYLAKGTESVGCIVISDEVKEEAAQAMQALKKLGVHRLVMLTGDSETAAKEIADGLAFTEYHAKLLPGDKVTCIETLMQGMGRKDRLAAVGDGMNDAPVLARADIGIAMGAAGSDAAIESADIVLMDDSLSHLALGVKIARATMRIIRENLIFAIGVKCIVMILCALGLVGMWWAVFADVGVMVLTVLNAVRLLKMKFRNEV